MQILILLYSLSTLVRGHVITVQRRRKLATLVWLSWHGVKVRDVNRVLVGKSPQSAWFRNLLIVDTPYLEVEAGSTSYLVVHSPIVVAYVQGGFSVKFF